MRDSIVAVIQARTGSTRLPGKVMLPLGERTVLEQMIVRVMRARLLDEVVVATTTLPEDACIVEVATSLSVPCFRGHPTDLLDRHVNAAAATDARHVVKIPSDCPLIDPSAIDAVLLAYLGGHGRVDYASNLHPATYPDGNDVEVISLRALEQAWHEATSPSDREHTTPFIWSRPERFRMVNVRWDGGRNAASTHRYVLDYPEDHAVIQAIFDALHQAVPEFGVDAIVDFLDTHRDVAALNARRRGTPRRDASAPMLHPQAGSAA